MGPFELVGQMDIHVDSRYGGLHLVGSVQHIDRVSDPFDTHLFDINVSMISLVLDVLHMLTLVPLCPGLLGWVEASKRLESGTILCPNLNT
jgi:hypothetical protein